MTLAELLVALALIPILLLSTTTLYLNVTNHMAVAMAKGRAITEKELVMGTLRRIIPNATTATIPTACSNPNNIFVWCSQLNLQMPTGTTPQNIYFRLSEQQNQKAVLETSTDGSSWTPVSYEGAIDRCSNQHPCGATQPQPFQVQLENGAQKVIINLIFETPDPSFPFIKILDEKIKPQGGSGVQ